MLVAGGRAAGVRLAGGETIPAARAVVAGVTPQHLYGQLLREGEVPAPAWRAAQAFRYGRAGMQIHLALDELPHWTSPEAERLARTALLHVTPGLDGVSRAVNEADRGLLPAEGTVVVGQPATVDPSRAPEGKSVIWIQLQELPRRPTGDALGELDVGDGSWTEALREAYADRIVERLGTPDLESRERHAEARRPLAGRPRGPQSATSWAETSTPARARSIRTCCGGRAGSCPATPRRSSGLWQIGASTHPGPGLGAGSGYLVAKQLLRPPLTRRIYARGSEAAGKLRGRLPL